MKRSEKIMNGSPGQTSAEISRPDRWGIAALVTFLVLFCPVTSLILLFTIYLGDHWSDDQIIAALLAGFLESGLLILGVIRILMGSDVTKRAAVSVLKNFWLGAASACLLGILLVLVNPVTAYSVFGAIWTIENFLLVVLPRVLITGVPAGGIGGAVLGNFWKHKRAAIAGGMIADLLVIPILFMLFPPVT
jgi:hypothetical protein